uniref:Ras-GEF domain-containing protein n=1 Tax=Elaeophora elaphi TaxID=1147741 RepID=A0A0R3RGJ1_9BILA
LQLPNINACPLDIQNAICEEFEGAECSVEVSPELSEPPFNFPFHALGRKIHLLPSGSTTPKDFYQISATSEGTIITDGLSSEYLHLVLKGGDDWRTPLQKVFNEKLGVNWYFLVMELQTSTVHFHTLHAQTKPIKSYAECTALWFSELKQISISPTLPKSKMSKKIVKKSLAEKNIADAEVNGKATTTKTTKNNNGQKIIRKKPATAAVSATVSPTATGITEDDTKIRNDSSVNGKKMVSPKAQSPLMNQMNGENYINGDGSADSGVSLVDSDTEKSSKCTKGSSEPDEQDRIPSTVKQNESVNDVNIATLIPTVKANLKTSNNDNVDNTDSANIRITSIKGNTAIYHNDLPSPFITRRSSMKYEMSGRVGRILEEEEKEKSDRCGGDVQLTDGHSLSDRCVNGRDPLIPMRRSAIAHINSTFPRSFLSNGSDSLQRLPSRDDISMIRKFADEEVPPVQVLQLVLKQFSYKELGELRQVHPHWDELCGQTLNSGYYELIKKADKLLTDCQRRVHSEPDLHDALSTLTSVQVHILNPVDVLRPAMDEGVCCFPYGELLDRTFRVVEKAKEMMEGRRDITVDWKPVAELARRAQLHYKFNLATLMEEKLGEVIRLKALQSIQRIDSFMIDSTYSCNRTLHRATNMARDELEWEIEQLRHQNAQLKKDNRELKKDCMRLEARVEIIENKFKTMARLLHVPENFNIPTLV